MIVLATAIIIALNNTDIVSRADQIVKVKNYNEQLTLLEMVKGEILAQNRGKVTTDEYITELEKRELIVPGHVETADGSKVVTTTTGFLVSVVQDEVNDIAISLGETNSKISVSQTTIQENLINGQGTKTSNITVTTENVLGNIIWVSSNENIVTVRGNNTNVVVVLKGVGTATITGIYGSTRATIDVTVTGNVPTISITPATISQTINSGETATVTLNATTENVSGELTWASNNTEVAEVVGNDKTAAVALKKGGTAEITASYEGYSSTCNVSVEEKVALTASFVSATLDASSVEDPGTIVKIDATLNKSIPNEMLYFKVRVHQVYRNSGNIAEEPENTYEFASTNASVSYEYNVGYGTMSEYLVYLDVLTADSEVLATYTFEKYTSWYSATKISYMVACMPAGTLILVEVEEEDENGKKKKVRIKKKIEDITYDDDLVVWDFDNGCFTTAKALWIMKKQEIDEYNVLKFSDGKKLKTVRQHRIFNKDAGKFTYPMTDETPIGTTTFNSEGEEVKLVSKEVVEGRVEYYNIISNYHMNIFAEGILTSCRLSNLYKIEDMKYVKDNRELVGIEEYKDIPEDFYYGLRLAEQPKEVNRGNDFKDTKTLKEYVQRCIRIQKER